MIRMGVNLHGSPRPWNPPETSGGHGGYADQGGQINGELNGVLEGFSTIKRRDTERPQ